MSRIGIQLVSIGASAPLHQVGPFCERYLRQIVHESCLRLLHDVKPHEAAVADKMSRSRPGSPTESPMIRTSPEIFRRREAPFENDSS